MRQRSETFDQRPRVYSLLVSFTNRGLHERRHFLWSAPQFEDEIAYAVAAFPNGPIEITVES